MIQLIFLLIFLQKNSSKHLFFLEQKKNRPIFIISELINYFFCKIFYEFHYPYNKGKFLIKNRVLLFYFEPFSYHCFSSLFS